MAIRAVEPFAAAGRAYSDLSIQDVFAMTSQEVVLASLMGLLLDSRMVERIDVHTTSLCAVLRRNFKCVTRQMDLSIAD